MTIGVGPNFNKKTKKKYFLFGFLEIFVAAQTQRTGGQAKTIEHCLSNGCAILYLGQGFLEIFVSGQSPEHWRPNKVMKLTFSHGITGYSDILENSMQRSIPVHLGCTGDQQQYITMKRQVFFALGSSLAQNSRSEEWASIE